MAYERNQDTEELDLTLGSRFLGPSMIINSEQEIAIGVTNKSPSSTFRCFFCFTSMCVVLVC